MSTTAHSPYHHKPRTEKQTPKPELRNKLVVATALTVVAALAVAGAKGKLKIPDFLNRPPVAEGQANNKMPPVVTDATEEQRGGRGGSVGSQNLCPWETPTVKNAAKAVLGTEVSCGPPASPDVAGAVWSNTQGTASVTVVVGSRANAVSPSALRDPSKAFSKNWEPFNAGTGPDTFCDMRASKVVTYQGELVVTTTLRDNLNQLPVGCTPQMGAFTQAFVQSGMLGRA